MWIGSSCSKSEIFQFFLVNLLHGYYHASLLFSARKIVTTLTNAFRSKLSAIKVVEQLGDSID